MIGDVVDPTAGLALPMMEDVAATVALVLPITDGDGVRTGEEGPIAAVSLPCQIGEDILGIE